MLNHTWSTVVAKFEDDGTLRLEVGNSHNTVITYAKVEKVIVSITEGRDPESSPTHTMTFAVKEGNLVPDIYKEPIIAHVPHLD